jgi:hypothetical protein
VEGIQRNLAGGILIELAAQTGCLDPCACPNVDPETAGDTRGGDAQRVPAAACAKAAVLTGRTFEEVALGKVAWILGSVNPRKHAAPTTLVKEILLENLGKVAMPGKDASNF